MEHSLFSLIFADDSGSMAAYGRMESLKKTAIHVAAIATALKESSQHIGGLSIRFINYGGDSNMNNIGTVADVEQALSNVYPSSDTKIGTELKRKVLEPFIMNVLERPGGKLDKPFLITIITDGEPAGESRSTLKNMILWCKEYMVSKGYGPWGEFPNLLMMMMGDLDLWGLLNLRLPSCWFPHCANRRFFGGEGIPSGD